MQFTHRQSYPTHMSLILPRHSLKEAVLDTCNSPPNPTFLSTHPGIETLKVSIVMGLNTTVRKLTWLISIRADTAPPTAQHPARDLGSGPVFFSRQGSRPPHHPTSVYIRVAKMVQMHYISDDDVLQAPTLARIPRCRIDFSHEERSTVNFKVDFDHERYAIVEFYITPFRHDPIPYTLFKVEAIYTPSHDNIRVDRVAAAVQPVYDTYINVVRLKLDGDV